MIQESSTNNQLYPYFNIFLRKIYNKNIFFFTDNFHKILFIVIIYVQIHNIIYEICIF